MEYFDIGEFDLDILFLGVSIFKVRLRFLNGLIDGNGCKVKFLVIFYVRGGGMFNYIWKYYRINLDILEKILVLFKY